jgi:hypothetical protein
MELDTSKLMFDMDKDEFENFYKILTNFKNLIEGSPSGYSDMASSSSGWSKKPTNSPIPSSSQTKSVEIPQLSLDGNVPPIELIDKSYSHLDDIDVNDMSLASLGELDEAEELSTELYMQDKQSDNTPSRPISDNSPPASPITPSPSSPPSVTTSKKSSESQQLNRTLNEEDDSEDLMAKISEMAAKIQNIPPPKPVAGVGTSKPLPVKVPLATPTVSVDAVKNIPIEEKENLNKSSSMKKKTTELKESDWDPW